ncbi:CHAD domain-containing protein [Desemzia sp. RIT804]|uniref:CHAD domain-containing protein n=1 Tax=Desemzia sp. RIT 804 TaxID=2810209 RepID=UPI001951B7B6|nr:CHAD domain-containing protein [Desemzia sp. RIT 804]MBM6614670.1 CHAD domain-containing protein [Desemzia sp. RIT 804]
MKQQIWLFRHGIAESKNNDKPDYDRALTPKGKKELESSVPNLRYLLDTQRPIFIWSSPLTRACETAEIISQALGNQKIIQKEFIATGDIGLLTAEIKKLSKESTVIVVGHEPTLSDWTEQLTGVSLPFDKGSSAAIQLKSSSESELLWFHQPESLKHLGSMDTHDSIKLRMLLQYQLRKIQSLHNAFLEAPSDVEIIHQFRVQIRHFRSLLSFLKPLLAENVYQEAKEPAKEAFKQFSRLRELDVLIDRVQTIIEEEPDLLEDSASVLTAITEAREKEKRRLVHSSNQKKIRTILINLLEWAETIDWFPLVAEIEGFTTFAKKRIKKKYQQLQKNISQLDYVEAKEIHEARKRAKTYRYVLKSFSPLLKKNYKKERKQAKKLQKLLSRITDIYENIVILNSFLSTEQDETLKKDFIALHQYETTQIQKQLLDLKQHPFNFH